jgi:hypothetical protein
MRRPLESAVLRRDERLDRTRRLSMLIAGGATAASLGLAGVLGIAIPGKAVTTGNQSQAGSQSGRQAGTQPRPQAGQPATDKTGGHRGSSHPHRLAAPSSAPSSSSAPPVVSSGGS